VTRVVVRVDTVRVSGVDGTHARMSAAQLEAAVRRAMGSAPAVAVGAGTELSVVRVPAGLGGVAGPDDVGAAVAAAVQAAAGSDRGARTTERGAER
jgi:hypothetical protein